MDTPTPLPAFDPKSKCVKCGYEIPEPPPPEPKFGPKSADGSTPQLPAPPPEPPQPPTVAYCSGEECPFDDPEADDGMDEHMHQFCDVCGYEWLALPLDATSRK